MTDQPDRTDEPESIRQLRDCADSYRDEDPGRAARTDAYADLLMRLINIPWDPSPLARLVRLCDSLRNAAIADTIDVCLDLTDDQLETLINTTIQWATNAIEAARKEPDHA